MMGVGSAGDVGELTDLLGDGKDGCDSFTQMINGLIDHFLTLEEFVWHYLAMIIF